MKKDCRGMFFNHYWFSFENLQSYGLRKIYSLYQFPVAACSPSHSYVSITTIKVMVLEGGAFGR
jgi:hypothetical protein